MQIKIFNIPVAGLGNEVEDMNKFLRGHKILEVEQHFVSNSGNDSWNFCVRYIAQGMPMQQQQKTGVQREKIDYRLLLNEEHFAVFTKLREIRKELAERDTVPVYSVFTNEELSQMAQMEEISLENVKNIKGIGEKKMEKYGEVLINIYNEARGTIN